MKKKIYLLVALLLIIAGFGYYINSDSFNEKVSKINPFLAVPQRTAAFAVVKNIHTLNQKLDSLHYYKNLQKSKLFSDFKEQLLYLDSFDIKLLENTLKYKQIIFALNNTGSSNLDFLTIIESQDGLLIKEMLATLKKKNMLFTAYNYQSQKIYTSTKKISFSVFNNLILLSNNTPLIEESLNGLINNKSKRLSTKYNSVANTKQADILVFIDDNKLSDIRTTIFNNEFLQLKNNIEDKKWSYFSLNFNESTIDFENENFYNKAQKTNFKNTHIPTAVKFTLDRFLPNNTAYFEALLSKDNFSFMSDAVSNQYFKPWLAEEAAFFCLETFDDDYLKKSGLVLKTKSIDTAKLNLYLLNKEMSPVDNYENLAIYKMNVDVLSKHFKSELFSFKKPFFAFIGQYVVFANDKSVIRTCFQKYKSNKFLHADLNFQKFIATKRSASKIVYLNPQKWSSTLDFMLNDAYHFNNFGKTRIETLLTDSSKFCIGNINFDIQKERKTTLLWELSLDTFSSFTPHIVVNADSKRKEIFTQDGHNKIYLINNSGDVVFKKQIEESIMSDVFQIDYFKSKKLQYVFNTKNYIYLIDRKGRMVEGFPLKLPSEASNGILVVNYDNAKNYRYFIACKNKNVYGYEANGKPLNAWSPLGAFGNISKPIKHSVFNGKDFIYFNNDIGSFYAFNRKGDQRFEAINLQTKFSKAFEKTAKGFINMGEGSIFKIDTKGKTTAKIIGDSLYTVFTNYSEKDAFAVANKNEFRVLKSKWTILGKRKINDTPTAITKLTIEEQHWFLVQGKKSVYLINDLGEIHPDFPKLSDSQAIVKSFIKNKKAILLLTEGNKLKAFELIVPEL